MVLTLKNRTDGGGRGGERLDGKSTTNSYVNFYALVRGRYHGPWDLGPPQKVDAKFASIEKVRLFVGVGDCKCNSFCICIIKVSVVLLLLLLLPLRSKKSETIVVLDVCSGSVLAIYESTINLKCSVFIEDSICNITPISILP